MGLKESFLLLKDPLQAKQFLFTFRFLKFVTKDAFPVLRGEGIHEFPKIMSSKHNVRLVGDDNVNTL